MVERVLTTARDSYLDENTQYVLNSGEFVHFLKMFARHSVRVRIRVEYKRKYY